MDCLKYIKNKYQLRFRQDMPIELPIDRHKGFPELLNELGLKTGVEIGVMKGWYSKWLFHGIKNLKLYCVDPWKVYDEYIEEHNPEKRFTYDEFFEETKKRLVGKNYQLTVCTTSWYN